MPTNILLLGLFDRIENNFHTTLIETILFIQVNNIESYFHSFGNIGNFEEEPLRVAICVDVVLEEEVVLGLGYLGYQG